MKEHKRILMIEVYQKTGQLVEAIEALGELENKMMDIFFEKMYETIYEFGMEVYDILEEDDSEEWNVYKETIEDPAGFNDYE